jgi:tetratricopeptide (TPR) repeat protein
MSGTDDNPGIGINKDLWLRAQPVFDELVDAPLDVRNARLDEVRRADPELADELASLLSHESQIDRDDFLGGSGIDAAGGLLDGRSVGSYTLERPIGDGGMGSVWLAHRSDGRFEAKVAFKVLARLTHPNISRLLDAGVHEGRPYLVLEHVDGETIDRWCDTRRLDVRARIRLFLDVLAAVAHAHGKLILHRDLKPSNIFVTSDGVVKLLDFGIATLLDEPDRAATPSEITDIAGRAFTIGYAAPEQLQGGEMTTATDVYALGVLLYLLLSGRHPTPMPSGRAMDQLRAVVEAEPLKLSVAASRTEPAAAIRRAAVPAQLARTLRGDLENIVARALKKAPAERYATVAALADDLRRFLHDEPVAACPDSVGYRARKFVRRHWAAVAAIVAVSVTLVSGAASTAWQAREAARQRDLALEQLDRAETARAFISQMLVGTWGADERISRNEFLARSEELALRELASWPERQSVVLEALGTFYGSLGDYDRALPLARRALALLPATASRSWRASVECYDAMYQWLVNSAESAKATLLRHASDPAVEPGIASLCASNLAKIALNQNDAHAALAHASTAQRLRSSARQVNQAATASIHGDLGYAYALMGRPEDAEREYRTALDIYATLDRSGSPNALAILNNWSAAAVNAGDLRRALSLFDEVIRLSRTSSAGRDPPPYAVANRASVLLSLGRYDEAVAQADDAFGIAERAGNRLFQASALLTKAGAYIERMDFASAEQALEQASRFTRDIPPDSNVALIEHLRRSRLALMRHEWADAATYAQPIIALFEARQIRVSTLAIALRYRAESESMLGDRPAALRDAEDALKICQTLQRGWRHSLQTGLSWLLLAQIRRDIGDASGAKEAAVQAAEHLGPMLGEDHRDTQAARSLAR